MADDLYTTWLDVPPGPRPPDHYALLGLPRFAGSRQEVEQAAHLQLHRLDRFALHPDPARREQCQRMMNEVARARVVLVNPDRRAAYDAELGRARPKIPALAAPAAAYPVPAGMMTPAAAPEEAPDELWQLAQAATQAPPTRRRRVGLLPLVPVLLVVATVGAVAYYYVTRVLPDTAARSAAETSAPTVRRVHPPATAPAGGVSPSPTTEPVASGHATVPAEPPPPPRIEVIQDWMSEHVRLDRTDVVYHVPRAVYPPSGGPFTLSIGPGVRVEGGEIDLRETGRLEIEGTPDKPAVLSNVTIAQRAGGFATAKYAVFDRCKFSKRFPSDTTSRHASKWAFDGCLLHACFFWGLQQRDYGIQWAGCTFVSMDLPEIEPRYENRERLDVMLHLRREWSSVTRCRFVNCAVRPTLVWCAVESNFAGCRFEPGLRYTSDTALAVAPWLADVAGPGPQEVWARKPPLRKPVYLVPADEPYEVFSFKDPLPVPELRDEAARRAADLSAYDAERRAAAKPAPELAGAPAPPATVFVCDASRFMDKHFETLQAELSKAVIGLKPSQRFNIVFFQGERPSALSPDLLPAATQNKVLALDFIHATAAHGDRDSRPALAMAFATKPQILHLLSTEDAPALNAVAATLAELNADKGVKVNVIRFGDGDAPQAATDAVLRRIAKENGGFYRYVDTGAAGAP